MTRKTIYDPINNDQWVDKANCLGMATSLFFPERGQSTAEAKAVCEACVVREACLEYALALGVNWGIFGGTSERQRRQLRRERREAAALRRFGEVCAFLADWAEGIDSEQPEQLELLAGVS